MNNIADVDNVIQQAEMIGNVDNSLKPFERG